MGGMEDRLPRRTLRPDLRTSQYVDSKASGALDQREIRRQIALIKRMAERAIPDTEPGEISVIDASTLADTEPEAVTPGYVYRIVDENGSDRVVVPIRQADGSLEYVEVVQAAAWPAQYVTSFGSAGTGNGQFNGDIRGIAADSNGDLYITSADHRLQKFSSNGTWLSTLMTGPGSGANQLNNPGGLVALNYITPNYLLICDTGNSRIIERAVTGTPSATAAVSPARVDVSLFAGITAFADLGTDVAVKLLKVWASGAWTQSLIAYVKPDGTVEIMDGPTGTHLRSAIRAIGSGPGQLLTPSDIDADVALNLLIADTGNHRVQAFTLLGIPLGSFGSAGTGDGQFDRPTAILVTPSYIYVGDSGNRRVQIWTNPMAPDPRTMQLVGWDVITWDPPNVASGSFSTPQTITIPGARTSDLVRISHSSQPTGTPRMRPVANVSSDDTVTYLYINDSGSSQNVPSGELVVVVERPPGR